MTLRAFAAAVVTSVTWTVLAATQADRERVSEVYDIISVSVNF